MVRRVGIDIEAKRNYDRETKATRTKKRKASGTFTVVSQEDRARCNARDKATRKAKREADPKLAGPRLTLSGRPCWPRSPSPVAPAPYQLPLGFSMEVDLFSDVMRLPTSTSASHDLNRVGLSYRCGRCGQPKKGHVCAVADGVESPGMLADSPAELAPAVTPEPAAAPSSAAAAAAAAARRGEPGWDLGSDAIFKVSHLQP